MSDEAIKVAPPPWQLKGTIYSFAFWVSKKQAAEGLPAHIAYSPLEAGSTFAQPQNGRPLGGLSMIQIIRYSETPVGPYDELILAPGFFEYAVDGKDGKRETRKNARITRIYVSQKHTCWNGRKNWNIPKHLAAFNWTDNQDGSQTVQVFPHDTEGDSAEAKASTKPFFQATIKPMAFAPSFPLSWNLLKYLGIDSTMVYPPLPESAASSQGELPGTQQWVSILPDIYSPRTSLMWFDMKQPEEQLQQQGGESAPAENFWPGLGRWQFGFKMEDAVIGFGDGLHWDPPKSLL
ncbi:hypothetical protein RB595_008819 [Gaeumannomyces hyphopodioides]